MYKDHSDDGLQIFLFPCNQFGMQEPGSPKEIRDFVNGYDVNFPVFEKIDVNGTNTHPVYANLRQNSKLNKGDNQCGGITWNFAKFLVDQNGKVINYYDPTVPPIDIKDDIKELLKQPLVAAAEEKKEEAATEEKKEEGEAKAEDKAEAKTEAKAEDDAIVPEVLSSTGDEIPSDVGESGP